MRTARVVSSLAILVALLVPSAAGAQEAPGSVDLSTPYVGVAVEPGESTTFTIDLDAPDGERIRFVVDAPDGWEVRLTGGGFVVDEVEFDPDRPPSLRLEVDVPAEATPGVYPLSVTADGTSGSDRLDLMVRVEEAVGGGVTLSTDFPFLRGPSDVVFNYSLTLENGTPEEIQFTFEADAPPGWTVDISPSGQSRAASVTVDAGGSTRLSVEVDPPNDTPAGQYPIVVRAIGPRQQAEAELVAEITGNFELVLSTADQRLNVDVEAGAPSELVLVVSNEGTAPLVDVALSAVPPLGWDVTFEPERIAVVEPGATAEVTARITPAEDAIAGDYRITFSARTPETSDSIEVRATVKTSAIWGLVGVGLIVAALGGLGFVFRRYGRR